eukprot:CAMPEP_0184498558 /NCGR_PEP_ID=MMETSP0113_2-20130426/39315_1 /TAXON_ID=91329 /ORGANISM="Norrisiella sphaerica, Strain BC52" /LENGTH=848 /DNA_ID=CAMNT_0026886135 /DNA_START=236 /DNA_END=2779 /DNA_ORIENTATION=-
MGNSLLKYYEWSRSNGASGGVGMFWQIFPGHDRKTKQEVSIFIAQKKNIPRSIRTEAFWEVIKQDASMLTRLRHPHVLDVKRAPCEERGVLVFITEPVVCSLANYMGDVRGVDLDPAETKETAKSNLKLPSHLEKVALSHLDVKNGLRQLVECLCFMHKSGKLAHCNVSPANIYLTKSGHWKLAGFGFSQKMQDPNRQADCAIDFGPFENPEERSRGIPEFFYSAPEMVLKKKVDCRSDVFSLGQVAYNVSYFIATKSLPKPVTNIDEYRAWIQNLHRPLVLTHIPKSLQKFLARMLAVDPGHRAPLQGFLSSDYYNDVLVRTLRYLDGLLQTDLKTRGQFLRQLPKVINLFDARSAEMKVLPKLLLQWKVADTRLMLFCVPAILKVAERMEVESFRKKIVPVLRKILEIKLPQFLYVVLSSFDMLIEKADEDVQQKVLVPILLSGLEFKEARLQQLAMRRIVETANANKFAYSALKTDVLPKIYRLAKGPGAAPVRAGALDALSNIFELFDKVTTLEMVLPAIEDSIKFGKSAVLLRSAIRLYANMGRVMGANVTATKILPKVIPLIMESSLSNEDVKMCLKISQDMLSNVGKLRLRQLSQSNMGGATTTDVNPDDLTAALDDSTDVGTFSDLLAKEYSAPESISPPGDTENITFNASTNNNAGKKINKPKPRAASSTGRPVLKPNSNGMGGGESDAFDFLSGGVGGLGISGNRSSTGSTRGSRMGARMGAEMGRGSAAAASASSGDPFGDLFGGGVDSGPSRKPQPTASSRLQQRQQQTRRQTAPSRQQKNTSGISDPFMGFDFGQDGQSRGVGGRGQVQSRAGTRNNPASGYNGMGAMGNMGGGL